MLRQNSKKNSIKKNSLSRRISLKNNYTYNKKSIKKIIGGKLTNEEVLAQYIIDIAKKSLEKNRDILLNLLMNDKLDEILKIEYSDKELDYINDLLEKKKIYRTQ